MNNFVTVQSLDAEQFTVESGIVKINESALPVGPAGANGTNGVDGAQGPQGERGPAGTGVESLPIIPLVGLQATDGTFLGSILDVNPEGGIPGLVGTTTSSGGGKTEREINNLTVIWWAYLSSQFNSDEDVSTYLAGTTPEALLATYLASPQLQQQYANMTVSYNFGGSNLKLFDTLFGSHHREGDEEWKVSEAYYKWTTGSFDFNTVEEAKTAISVHYADKAAFLDWAGITSAIPTLPVPAPTYIKDLHSMRLLTSDGWVDNLEQVSTSGCWLGTWDSRGMKTGVIDLSEGNAYRISISGSGGDVTSFKLKLYDTNYVNGAEGDITYADIELPTWPANNVYPSGDLEVVLYSYQGTLYTYTTKGQGGEFDYKGPGNISIASSSIPVFATSPNVQVALVVDKYWNNLVNNGMAPV